MATSWETLVLRRSHWGEIGGDEKKGKWKWKRKLWEKVKILNEKLNGRKDRRKENIKKEKVKEWRNNKKRKKEKRNIRKIKRKKRRKRQ